MVSQAVHEIPPHPTDDRRESAELTALEMCLPAQISLAPTNPQCEETGPVLLVSSDLSGEDAKVKDQRAPDEDDFMLADGTTLPFAEWVPGLLPADRIRNQLAAICEGWRMSAKPDELASAVLAQKLVVSLAALINRLMPAGLAAALVSGLPEQVEAACRQLKTLWPYCVDEAISRICNVLRTKNRTSVAV